MSLIKIRAWTLITLLPNEVNCAYWQWFLEIYPMLSMLFTSLAIGGRWKMILNVSTIWHTPGYTLRNNTPICCILCCCGYSISQEICTRFLLCCALLWLYIDWISHIHQAYFTGTNDCPSASKATLMNMDKYFMWIQHERLHNHNKAKHNKTVCTFLGIYSMSSERDPFTQTIPP